MSRSWADPPPRTYDIRDCGSWATPDHRTPVWLVLLTSLAVTVLFFGLVVAGRAGMCEINGQQAHSYCPSYLSEVER